MTGQLLAIDTLAEKLAAAAAAAQYGIVLQVVVKHHSSIVMASVSLVSRMAYFFLARAQTYIPASTIKTFLPCL